MKLISTSKEDITQSVKCLLIFIFDRARASHDDKLKSDYKNYLEFANEAVQPIFQKETLRYQAMTFYFSLALIFLTFFDLKSFKILGNETAINQSSLLFITLITASITLIFLSKAILDIRADKIRVNLKGYGNTKIHETMKLNVLKEHLDLHYLREIDRLFHITYIEISDWLNELAGSAEKEPFRVNYSEPLLELFKYKDLPELVPLISEREGFVEELKKCIYDDIGTFKKEIKAKMSSKRKHESISFITSSSIYTHSINKWFQARNQLSHESREIALELSHPLHITAKTILGFAKTVNTNRKLSVIIEVIIPVCISLATLVFVWFRLTLN